MDPHHRRLTRRHEDTKERKVDAASWDSFSHGHTEMTLKNGKLAGVVPERSPSTLSFGA